MSVSLVHKLKTMAGEVLGRIGYATGDAGPQVEVVAA